MNRTAFKDLSRCLAVCILASLMAMNYRLFIIPNHFAPAGINGIATMVQYRFGFSIAYMSLMINVPLCIISYVSSDRRFAVMSLIFCVTYSGVFLLSGRWDLSSFVYDAHGIDTVYPCLIAGTASGAILGLCFRLGASSGGTDIISRLINRKRPEMNFFWISFTLNAAVAAASFFVYADTSSGSAVYDYKPVCLCLIYCFVSSFLANRIMSGNRMACQFTIITEHPLEIEHDIIERLHHSATCFKATGAYSEQDRSVILCVINRGQIMELKDILSKYDRTFSYVETVTDTIGNFKRIRHH